MSVDRKAAAAPRVEVGGVFVATKNVARLVSWYRALGIPLGDDGMFAYGEPGQAPRLVFSIQPSAGELPATGGDLREEPYGLQRVTLNLRVPDLAATVALLRKAGDQVAGPKDAGYGLFAWAKDPDGNLVELWQPGKPPA